MKRCLNYFIDYRFRKEVLDSLMDTFFEDEGHLVNEYYMNETELARMQRAGMIVGSHTVTHPVMSKLDEVEQKREIRESFTFLERATNGLAIRTFCYPYGGFHSFTESTEQFLADAGCVFSFNVEPRDIADSDLKARTQALPRYDCNMFPHGTCRPVSC